MQRHPFQLEVDAAYVREQIAAQVDACRGTGANVPGRATTQIRPGMISLRRTLGEWLIGIGERLTDSRQADTPPAWSVR